MGFFNYGPSSTCLGAIYQVYTILGGSLGHNLEGAFQWIYHLYANYSKYFPLVVSAPIGRYFVKCKSVFNWFSIDQNCPLHLYSNNDKSHVFVL